MKKFLLMSMMLAAGIPAMCQYSTDKFTSLVEYRSMPTYYVPEDSRTFCVSASGTKQIKEVLDYDLLDDTYTPSGWTFNTTDPYLVAYIDVDNFEVLKSWEKEDFEEVREHGETVRHPIFYPAVDYLLPITITVKSAQATTTYQNREDNYEKKWVLYTWVGPKAYHDPRDAHDYYMDNKDIIVEQCVNSVVPEFYKTVASSINSDYVYGTTSEFVPTWLLDSKKSEFYTQFKDTKNQIKAILMNYKYNTDPATIIRQLKPYIDILKQEADALDASDKKQSQAKADILNGLAHIYYCLEIFDVAKDYAQQVINLGDNNGAKLNKRITTYQADLEKHHLTTKHF